MTQSTKQLTLGTESVGRLLIKYSVPAIIAMLASSLYNIVDRIFIGQGVGAMAISGLAITFPLMNLSAAFGSLVGAGGAALVSIKMGQQDKQSATTILGNVTMLNIILGVVIMALGLIFLDPILLFFGASYDTIGYARDYMQIILAGNIITHLYLGLNNVMRSSGYPEKAMLMTILTVVINAMLDPIFIFVLGWGIRGAAVATIIAQIIALVVVLHHFRKPTSFIHFKQGCLRLQRTIVKGIFSIGMAPFMMNLCACLVVILVNKALKTHGGDLAIGAFGIVNSVIMVFVMMVMGFTQGMQPIAGYNFGAGHGKRVERVLWLTVMCATVCMVVAFLVGELFPRQLAYIFNDDPELVGMAARGMRIAMCLFPIVGFQMVTANFFQSIGKAHKAIFLSTTRQLLFIVPLVLVLPRFYGIDGVWWSFPIADLMATVLAAVLLFNETRKFKRGSQG